ncbi:hypothetical protein FB451DRAFT_478416 [Mycena latifolia]|nr:hypothetical protein FB451DRAFT_478416 [Mycena latifolia]
MLYSVLFCSFLCCSAVLFPRTGYIGGFRAGSAFDLGPRPWNCVLARGTVVSREACDLEWAELEEARKNFGKMDVWDKKAQRTRRDHGITNKNTHSKLPHVLAFEYGRCSIHCRSNLYDLDMPLPRYVSERFDLFNRATPDESEWYGPVNTLLGVSFPPPGVRSSTAIQRASPPRLR